MSCLISSRPDACLTDDGTLEIWGFAVGCDRVVVSITEVRPDGTVETIHPAEEQEVHDGVWSLDFRPDPKPECGSIQPWRVEVTCASNSKCKHVREALTIWCVGRESCPELPKPPEAEPRADLTCLAGSRPYTLSITFSPPLSSGSTGRFVGPEGDVSGELPQVIAPGGTASRFTASPIYLRPGWNTVAFVITGHPCCRYPFTLSVDVCRCVLELDVVRDDGSQDRILYVDASGDTWGGTAGEPAPGCIDPRTYLLRARVDGQSIEWPHRWSVDGVRRPEDGAEIQVLLPAGGSPLHVEVSVDAPGCEETLARHVDLLGCADDCPTDPFAVIEVREHDPSGGGGLVFRWSTSPTEPDPPCVAPGLYDLVTTVPHGAQPWTYLWKVGQQVLGSGGSNILSGYELKTDGSTSRPTFEFSTPHCESYVGQLPLRACKCPGPLSIRITQGSRVVRDKDCVDPGNYRAELVDVPEDLDSKFKWFVDDREEGEGQDVRFHIAGWPQCDERRYRHKVQVRSVPTNAEACPPVLAERELEVCERWRLCIPCWLLRVLLLFLVLVMALAIPLAICGVHLSRPAWLDWIAAHWAASPEAAASLEGISTTWQLIASGFLIFYFTVVLPSSFVLALIVLAIYINLCKPSLCMDWWVLAWQLILGLGLLLLYFATCPMCALPFGIAGVIAVGVAAAVGWAWFNTCKPGVCRALLELYGFAAAFAFIPLAPISIVMAPCNAPWAPFLQWLFGILPIVFGTMAVICYVTDLAKREESA